MLSEDVDRTIADGGELTESYTIENVADSTLVVIGRLKTFSPSVLTKIPVRGKGAGSYFNYRVSRLRKNAISSARPVMSER